MGRRRRAGPPRWRVRGGLGSVATWVVVSVLLGVAAAALGLPALAEHVTAPRYVVPAAELAAAHKALASLQVKGRAPTTGYEREQFGQAWADVDRNGCDTRNDVLRRDLAAVELDPETHGCVVLRGTLHDPYGGGTVAFERGPGSADVQIDHVVALADAWQKGAQQWPQAQREAFANDPLNLLAVDGPLNQQKGAGDAATWLPPNKGYRCPYAIRQVTVKARYGVWVTTAERDALERELGRCVAAPG